jgi:hypothetical protein
VGLDFEYRLKFLLATITYEEVIFHHFLDYFLFNCLTFMELIANHYFPCYQMRCYVLIRQCLNNQCFYEDTDVSYLLFKGFQL